LHELCAQEIEESVLANRSARNVDRDRVGYRLAVVRFEVLREI
jgi:hypothetical protein